MALELGDGREDGALELGGKKGTGHKLREMH